MKKENREQILFEMVYRVSIAPAKRCLEDSHNNYEGYWSQRMRWIQLGSSSQSIFLKRAHEEAGVSNEDFKEYIRSGDFNELLEKFYG